MTLIRRKTVTPSVNSRASLNKDSQTCDKKSNSFKLSHNESVEPHAFGNSVKNEPHETNADKSNVKGNNKTVTTTRTTVQNDLHLQPTGTKTVYSSLCYRLFGCEWQDVSRWSALVKLLNRPTDPSSLGVMRILFGLLMLLDVFHERGMHMIEHDYGDPTQCRFPLFDLLKPLPMAWMYVVFLSLILGSLGIMLGLLYRLSCLLFTIAYWYLFLLDKSTWNNHSYLYGLCAILLLLTDANRYWSLDGLLWRHKRDAHIPLWNYTLFRAQFFLVYFVAGLKKLDHDWIHGYSMNRLSAHWVFTPFTHVLSHEEIDLWIVHRSGLCLDLFIGFVLFFDVTRPFGFLFGGMFHVMNSRMFSIGMFPYTMLATMPIFCHADWPRKLINRMWAIFGYKGEAQEPQANSHCYYVPSNDTTKTYLNREEKKKDSCTKAGSIRPRHKMSTLFVIAYLCLQCFLPYSHFLTKGYNNWTNGLYGYSWDMMVHSWSTQHITISYKNLDTGHTGYLKPDAWTQSGTRWVAHCDMTKQYAMCIRDRLRDFNISNVELYFDVWRSLNDRFQQRLYDPRVDLVTAEWHPFKSTTWVMPLLSELSDWRGKLDDIEKDIYAKNNDTDVVFIADFPGLQLINYVQEDLGNTSVQVLNGDVMVEFPDSPQPNVRLAINEKLQLPAGAYHYITTVSDTPSCFMYIFKNTTEVELSEEIKRAEQSIKDGTVKEEELNGRIKETRDKIKKSKDDMAKKASLSFFEEMKIVLAKKYKDVYRSLWMMQIAVHSIVTGADFEQVFNSTVLQDSKVS